MLLDVKELEVKLNFADEWSLYRVTKDGTQRFLLFSFGDNHSQAVEKGKAIAKILGVRFKSGSYYDSTLKEEKEDVVVKKRRARVKGVFLLCRQMVSEGKSNIDIEKVLTERYSDAGYDEKEAKQAAHNIRNSVRK